MKILLPIVFIILLNILIAVIPYTASYELIVLSLTIVVGLVLLPFALFRKKRLMNAEGQPLNDDEIRSLNVKYIEQRAISDEGKKVVLNELYKRTSKKFTIAWFLEYWQGKRTLFYAFWLWAFIVPSIVRLLYFIVMYAVDKHYTVHSPMSLSELLIDITYFLIPLVIVWRCGNNATVTWKVISRIYLVIILIMYLFAVLGVLL